MTDKQRLIQMFEDFGIGFNDDGESVICEQGMSKVDGYSGFEVTYFFDDDGRFKNMSIYE